MKKLHIKETADITSDFTEDEADYTRITVQSLADMQLLDEVTAGSEAILKIFSDNNHVEKPIIYGAGFICDKKYYYVNLSDDRFLTAFLQFLQKKSCVL